MSDGLRPNVVFITTHDSGRHFGCYGAKGVDTPNIDRLAAEGMQFNKCYSASPASSPSRGALMTGRYPQSNGLMGLVHEPWWWSLKPDERHLADLLGAVGYRTCLMGVQHESLDARRLGFEEVHECREGDGQLKSAVQVAEQFGELLPRMGRSQKSFYVQIGFVESHTPYRFGGAMPCDPAAQSVPPFLVDDEQSRNHLAGLSGAVEQADRAVGLILDALDVRGLRRNTLVVFTVDHGPELGRLSKWSCRDAGIAVALLMRWEGGGIEGGKKVEALVSAVDVVPTICEFARIPMSRGLPSQGRSMSRLIAGKSSSHHDVVFSVFDGDSHPRCIRTRRHKLIRNFEAARALKIPGTVTGSATHWAARPFVELYDLVKDPDELVNVAEEPDYVGVRAQLDAQLIDWMRAVEDPILRGPVPSPYYRRSMADLLGACMTPAQPGGPTVGGMAAHPLEAATPFTEG